MCSSMRQATLGWLLRQWVASSEASLRATSLLAAPNSPRRPSESSLRFLLQPSRGGSSHSGLGSVATMPLEVASYRCLQSFMIVGDHKLHAWKAPALKRAEKRLVGGLALGVCSLNSEYLPEAVIPRTRDEEDSLADHLMAYPDLLVAGVHEQVRVSLGLQRPAPPCLKLCVEASCQRGDEALGEGGAAQLFGYVFDLPGRDPLHIHLHQRQHQRLLVSLVTREQPGGERTFAVLGDEQVQRAYPRP